MTKESVQGYERRYGPYAFGVLSLIMIWFTVVAPELKAQRGNSIVDLEAARAHVLASERLAQITVSQQQIADRLKEITSTLLIVTDRVRQLSDGAK